MDPHLDRGDRQKRLKARRNALPAYDQAAVLLLAPSNRPLGLEPWDALLDWATTMLLRLPAPLGHLGAHPALSELLPQGFGIIPFIRRDDLEALAWPTALARAECDRIEQGQHLSPLVPVGRCGAMGQRHPRGFWQAVDQHPFACAAACDALPTPLARGKKRHPRRHTPNESSRVLRQGPESGLAWRRGCHPPASAATSAASHSSMPTVVHAGHPTSDSQ